MCEADKTRCEEVESDDAYLQDVEEQDGAFDTYQAVAASWTRSKTGSDAALAAGSRLSAAELDSLWIFEPNERGVRVLQVDDAGELSEQAVVLLWEPPQPVADGYPVIRLGFDAPDARGPLLVTQVSPKVDCSEDTLSQLEPDVTCLGDPQQNVLVFDRDPGAAPRIVAPESPDLLPYIFTSVARAHSGDDLFTWDAALTRLDAQGAVRWTQASTLPDTDGFSAQGVAGPVIDALDDDRIAFLAFAGLVAPAHAPEYWVVDGSGAVLEAHTLPRIEAPQTALFHSPAGDKLIAGGTSDGDLALMGIHADDSVTIFTAPREHYTFQQLLGASMDSAGTLYAATRAGGQRPEDQTTLLCRLVDARTGDCFKALDVPPIVDVQATTPNVVYTLSDDGSLRRFDLSE